MVVRCRKRHKGKEKVACTRGKRMHHTSPPPAHRAYVSLSRKVPFDRTKGCFCGLHVSCTLLKLRPSRDRHFVGRGVGGSPGCNFFLQGSEKSFNCS